jgi:hypothetical protein
MFPDVSRNNTKSGYTNRRLKPEVDFQRWGPPALATMCVRKNPSPKLLRAEVAFRSCVPDTSRLSSTALLIPHRSSLFLRWRHWSAPGSPPLAVPLAVPLAECLAGILGGRLAGYLLGVLGGGWRGCWLCRRLCCRLRRDTRTSPTCTLIIQQNSSIRGPVRVRIGKMGRL